MVSRRWNVMKGLADGLWRAEVEEGVEEEEEEEDGRGGGRWKMEDGEHSTRTSERYHLGFRE